MDLVGHNQGNKHDAKKESDIKNAIHGDKNIEKIVDAINKNTASINRLCTILENYIKDK